MNETNENKSGKIALRYDGKTQFFIKEVGRIGIDENGHTYAVLDDGRVFQLPPMAPAVWKANKRGASK
jgi:hypothetical protein